MNSVINDLVTKAGVDRSSLYMAWDFTVASQESVTGRALSIRDDAFARLGENNLANRVIEGDSPVVQVNYVLRPVREPQPECSGNRRLQERPESAFRTRPSPECPGFRPDPDH